MSTSYLKKKKKKKLSFAFHSIAFHLISQGVNTVGKIAWCE